MDTIDSSPLSNQMSRRAVLIGSAALGAVGATGLVTGGQPAVAQALRPSVPIPHGARVGATFNLLPFPKGTMWGQAVDEWNKRTGTQMRCWKVYFQEGDFPASIDAQIQTIGTSSSRRCACGRRSARRT
jgi:hypothetical protein